MLCNIDNILFIMNSNSYQEECDIPEELNVKGTLRFQWLRNREGGQSFGSQTIIAPMNDQIYQAYVRPRLRNEYQGTLNTLSEFLARWPNDTHVEILSSEGRWEWRMRSVGPLRELRPKNVQMFYADKVESFTSTEAIEWGSKADSDVYPNGVLDPLLDN